MFIHVVHENIYIGHPYGINDKAMQNCISFITDQSDQTNY